MQNNILTTKLEETEFRNLDTRIKNSLKHGKVNTIFELILATISKNSRVKLYGVQAKRIVASIFEENYFSLTGIMTDLKDYGIKKNEYSRVKKMAGNIDKITIYTLYSLYSQYAKIIEGKDHITFYYQNYPIEKLYGVSKENLLSLDVQIQIKKEIEEDYNLIKKLLVIVADKIERRIVIEPEITELQEELEKTNSKNSSLTDKISRKKQLILQLETAIRENESLSEESEELTQRIIELSGRKKIKIWHNLNKWYNSKPKRRNKIHE